MAQFSVKAICQILGIHPSTLRAWERRYEAMAPERSASGRRSYSSDDLERLQLLVKLVNSGHGIGTVAVLKTEMLRKLLSQGEKARSPAQEMTSVASVPEVLQVIDNVRSLHLDKLHSLLDRARLRYDARTFVLGLISPLMHEVGHLVSQGSLSIFHEHALSAIVKANLGNLHSQLGANHKDSKGSVCLATREGDYHEFGILIAAVLCCVYGQPYYYLGCNMPAAVLAEAAKALRADKVLVGSVELPPHLQLPSAGAYLDRVDKELEPSTNLLWGGYLPHPPQALTSGRFWKHFRNLIELDQFLADNFLAGEHH